MRTPVSTYRLQISEDFTLLDAARTLPYLRDLGADWVYLSPILAAEPGSNHGYDVVDHRVVDPSRGGAAGLAALSAEARRLGLGVLVDVVPNHVGIAGPSDNPWWWDVLTHGRRSAYASAFDIDWDAADGKLLVPVVGDDDLGTGPDGRESIANLSLVGGELRYHDNRFPVAPGTARPGDDAPAVHARQHYRLVGWRTADTELNYRRFFTVNTLAGIRVEDRTWFERSHVEIRRWFEQGLVDGLRIDHPDGLRDPGGYLDALAELTGGGYVLVEKILEPGEALPASWATAGTTGYDVLGLVDRVLTDPAGEAPLTGLQDELRGGGPGWHELIHDTKRAVADGSLGAEVRRIVRELEPLVDGTETSRLVDAVAELLACFPVYRSYLPEGREHLEQAIAAARRSRPDLGAVLDVVAPVLGDGASAPAQRFQQTSGMVMAKGVEDCAFYRWSRLTSLNEVGGDPGTFSVDAATFHAEMAVRQAHWPHAMTAMTTHDTKRSEDTRARIGVLAEVPDRWRETLEQLQRRAPVPDAGFANLLWQAVVGAWTGPSQELRRRLHAYAEKAMREAGDRTAWTAPDEAYERAVHDAVDAAFDDPEVGALLERLVADLAGPGWVNGLSAKLLALTLPGVPDVYQGTELWDQSLVDPDNRRPVDFDRRVALLDGVRTGDRPGLTGALEDDGGAKLALTHAALTLRRALTEVRAGSGPAPFSTYVPVTATGPAAGHLLAFDRGGVVTAVTRLPVGLAQDGGWRDTALTLPAGAWVDVLSGRRFEGEVPVAELLGDLPVALLARRELVDPGEHGRFDVWAPRAQSLSLSLQVGGTERVVAMTEGPGDWWHPTGPVPVGPGVEVDYGYLVDGSDTAVPDPRSRWQPDGVHARSRTFDTAAHTWQDEAWTGRPLGGSVIYELHLGTFTPEGTLDAAATRLDHLRSIGVDFVELLPVNAYNGEWGWGYDGVAWSAVHQPYGGPAAYQRFVDACHVAGIGVVQDVVYNHFGPSGNYLGLFGPYTSTEGQSAWGEHLNLDGEGSVEVRRTILDNLRMWFEDFHVDGLRLDAVHALPDRSETHLLEEMAVVTAQVAAAQRKPLFLVAESDLNDPHLVTPREGGGYGLDGQWSDDYHHAVHVALTREVEGYYADFEPLAALAKVCEKGFFHDGSWSSFRGAEHGKPVDTAHMPAWRLVVCNQNHDQVGNRARGDRLTERLDDDQLACAALLTLCGPFTPMLFQGEEWAATTPFAFFTSHPEADLGKAVSEGRVKEFAKMGWDLAQVPDPQAASTFLDSKLDWTEPEGGRHAVLLSVYRSLAALRRRTPALTDPDLRTVSCSYDEDARWFLMRRTGGGPAGPVAVAVNVGDDEVSVPLDGPHEVVWATPSGATTGRSAVVLPPHAGAVLRPLP